MSEQQILPKPLLPISVSKDMYVKCKHQNAQKIYEFSCYLIPIRYKWMRRRKAKGSQISMSPWFRVWEYGRQLQLQQAKVSIEDSQLAILGMSYCSLNLENEYSEK